MCMRERGGEMCKAMSAGVVIWVVSSGDGLTLNSVHLSGVRCVCVCCKGECDRGWST